MSQFNNTNWWSLSLENLFLAGEIHYFLLNIRKPGALHGCSQDLKSRNPRPRRYIFKTETRPRRWIVITEMRPRRSIFPNSQDRDETEMFNLQDRDETKTFQKSPRDRDVQDRDCITGRRSLRQKKIITTLHYNTANCSPEEFSFTVVCGHWRFGLISQTCATEQRQRLQETIVITLTVCTLYVTVMCAIKSTNTAEWF